MNNRELHCTCVIMLVGGQQCNVYMLAETLEEAVPRHALNHNKSWAVRCEDLLFKHVRVCLGVRGLEVQADCWRCAALLCQARPRQVHARRRLHVMHPPRVLAAFLPYPTPSTYPPAPPPNHPPTTYPWPHVYCSPPKASMTTHIHMELAVLSSHLSGAVSRELNCKVAVYICCAF